MRILWHSTLTYAFWTRWYWIEPMRELFTPLVVSYVFCIVELRLSVESIAHFENWHYFVAVRYSPMASVHLYRIIEFRRMRWPCVKQILVHLQSVIQGNRIDDSSRISKLWTTVASIIIESSRLSDIWTLTIVLLNFDFFIHHRNCEILFISPFSAWFYANNLIPHFRRYSQPGLLNYRLLTGSSHEFMWMGKWVLRKKRY